MTGEPKPFRTFRDSGVPWLGDVPSHWGVTRNKYLFREVNDRSPDGDRQLLTVSQYTGVTKRRDGLFKEGEATTDSASLTGYKVVTPGDLVMNIMLAWNGSLGVAAVDGIASPAYCVFRANAGAAPRFFHYLFRTPLFTGAFKTVSRGVVDSRLRLYPDAFFRLSSPVPPLAEQAAIVRFLDHANRRIRRYIAAKQELIVLLNEQKQAIIQRFVTRGFDPNVQLKPSPVEWLGDVPQHWSVSQLRWLVRLGKTITYGIVQPGEPDPSGRFMVRGQDYSSGWAKPETLFRVSDAIEAPYKRSRLSAGDIVMTIVGAGVGNVAIVPGWLDGANITQTTARIAVDPTKSDAEFIAFVLQGPVGRQNVDLHVKGAAQPGLNLEHVRIFLVPVPPLEEQRAIASAIRDEIGTLQVAADRAARGIALVREYGRRLISDVVTGQFDVLEAATRLPDENDEPEPPNAEDEGLVDQDADASNLGPISDDGDG